MPTYEYECEECGRRFEQFQSIRDAPTRSCPKCGGPVSRLLGTGAAVIVKGSRSVAAEYARGMPRCGRDAPCCGREIACDQPPCDK